MIIDFKQRLFAAQTRYYANDSHDIEIVREICDALIALKREGELLLWADRALALSPNAPDIVAMRASSLNLLGRHAEAADVWASNPLLSGDPALYRVRIGYGLMMAGDLARAIPLLEEARGIAASSNVPILATVEHLLGEAMLKAGDSGGFAHWLMRNRDLGSAGSYCPVGIPMWAGEKDLRGRRVLITHQLGFGDNFLLAALLTSISLCRRFSAFPGPC
jgi:hypothetical protein